MPRFRHDAAAVFAMLQLTLSYAADCCHCCAAIFAYFSMRAITSRHAVYAAMRYARAITRAFAAAPQRAWRDAARATRAAAMLDGRHLIADVYRRRALLPRNMAIFHSITPFTPIYYYALFRRCHADSFFFDTLIICHA